MSSLLQLRRKPTLVRLRLPDRPGSLAAVTAHLATYGVDVLGLEVLEHGDGTALDDTAIDDLLLAGDGLDVALASLGPKAMVLGRRPGVDLRDPGLAMAQACEEVSSARTAAEAYHSIVRAGLGLVFAEVGLLCISREGGILAVVSSTADGLPSAVDGRAPSLLTSALTSGERLTADGRIPWAPADLQCRLPEGSVGVVPAGPLVLALVRADHAPFVPLELARLGALLNVASATLGLHETRVRQLREVAR